MQQQLQQQQQQQQHQNRSGSQNNMPGRPGPQRYPTPIQRPTNYPQHQQTQQPSQQRPIRQPHSGQVNSGPMNKHYYPGGGRGKI